MRSFVYIEKFDTFSIESVSCTLDYVLLIENPKLSSFVKTQNKDENHKLNRSIRARFFMDTH